MHHRSSNQWYAVIDTNELPKRQFGKPVAKPTEVVPATPDTISKKLDLPEEVMVKVKKMLDAAASDEEKARITEIFNYLSNVYGSSKNVLDNLPGDISAPRNILIPLSQKFCPITEGLAPAKYQALWGAELRKILEKRGFTNLNVLFYDGSSEDLQKKLTKIDNPTPENTIAYVDAELKVKAESLNRSITIVNERAPQEGAYMSLGGHVTLGIGILDIINRKEVDGDAVSRVARLIAAVSGDLAVAENYNDPAKMTELIKNGNLIIKLPAVKKIDIDKNMEKHFTMESALKTSL